MADLQHDLYDVTVMGTGPAGLTAAIYTCRADLNTVMFEGNLPGGQLTQTTEVENYPGFRSGIDGFLLIDEMREQAKRFGAEIHYAMIEKVDTSAHPYTIHLDDGSSFKTKTLIVASGARPRKLGFPGEEKFWGRGISSCATCDAAFYREQVVAVVGGGDSAMEEATFLTKFAKKVYVVHRRDELRASKIMQQRAMTNDKIEFLWSTEVVDVYGNEEDGVKGMKLRDRKTDEISDVDINGFFLAIGHIPNTSIFGEELNMDAEGYIQTRPDSTHTNIEAIFAVGDVQDNVYRQAITAAGSGCKGALDAEHFLASLQDKGTS